MQGLTFNLEGFRVSAFRLLDLMVKLFGVFGSSLVAHGVQIFVSSRQA